jgi:iron complex outermembrane receptor protein
MFKLTAVAALVMHSLFPNVAGTSAYAQGSNGFVRGYVKDSQTKSPLPGATIVVRASTDEPLPKSPSRFTTTDENGYFQLPNFGSETVQAEVRFLGYKTKIEDLTSSSSAITILMEEDIILTDEVIVSATRATEKSGATFSTISKQALQKQNFGQDLPMVLNWTPSLVSTSDAGGGVGYTGLRIRGSDATRVNITINGIPYNDSESQGTFWVNIPDVASSTQSIQVQRGVGTSTNGAGAFGASINLQTNVRNDKPYADVINSFGSFNTRRHTIGLGSGVVNGKFVFDGRLSTIKSDGYIDRASSDLKSYYMSGGYYGEKTMLKAIVFGGQEITYQSWNGVPESRLKNDGDAMEVTALAEGWNEEQRRNLLTSDNRRFNMFLYPNQVDNYKQDHYQLHFSHRFVPTFTANAAFHYTYGRGFYEEYRYDNDFEDYGLPSVEVGGTTFESSDLIRQRWLNNHFYGLTFSLNHESERFNSIFGGGINRYDGDHFGRILWSSINAGLPASYQYYFNNGLKDDMNFFLKHTYQATEQLSVFVDLQYRGISYKTSGRENRQFDFNIDRDFHFFNPKFGLTWNITPSQNFYASYSRANREPVRDDFVDALGGVEPKPESMNDIEAGWRFRKDGYSLSANYYYMDYRNQLVLTGALNDVGASIRTNVDKSYRTGVEFEAIGRLSRSFSLGANLTLSENKIRDFIEVLYDYGENFDEYNVVENAYGKTDISFSPNVIAGGVFSYTLFKGMELSLLTKYVGKQYLDNTSNDNRKIDPYFTNDLRLVYTLNPAFMREISISMLANNILDEKYESNGYTYGYFAGPTEIRQNYFYPQAGRNFMVMVALRF